MGRRGLVVVVVTVGLIVLGVIGAQVSFTSAPSVGYGTFLEDVAAGHVYSVDQQDQTLHVNSDHGNYQATAPTVLTDVYHDVSSAATRGGVAPPSYTASAVNDMSWVGLFISGFLPVVLIGGFIFFMVRRAPPPLRTTREPDFRARLKEVEAAWNEGLITQEEREAARKAILEHP